MAGKRVYAFGAGSTESEGQGKNLLGGKGFGLAEMSRLGIPVPPGFTITTEVCNAYNENGGKYPDGLEEEVAAHVTQLEGTLGQNFGDPANPLLVSVRSGAPLSMPGMMDTILNLGLNDAIVETQSKLPDFDVRSLLDAYRRLIAMYSNIVMDIPRHGFEAALTAARGKQGVATDAELSRESLAEVCCKFMGIVGEAGKTFPQDPKEQLWGAITAVFESWNGDRAKAYRKINGISDKLGTAVNVQAMVFGNRGGDCATGVAFTRNPATGEGKIYGEFLTNAQGEDVVAGIRTPQTIEATESSPGLAADFPDAARDLEAVAKRLEAHFRDMQDLEFTIQHGKLFMLQTRTGKRTGPAAVRIAAEMVGEGVIDSAEALKR
ncbi:MAG TPA: PEP/pyruvate-binding domain-containing protein, partial [Thermoanaerobaculia bacterium]|nr:PEP/pyruvate-binding domain-containing protein [Thermoanaerobaculia bacterium]